MRLSCLYIDETAQKGRGVFTNESIPLDTVLEIAPVIVMSLDERKLLDQTLLHDYIFLWGEKEDRCAMALGWIPVFNHSYQSNCEYFMDFEGDAMFVKTIRAVDAGEELTINYNGTWNNEKPVWFDAK
jgi:SET domain-containing protein